MSDLCDKGLTYMLICCCVLFTQLRYTVARFNYTTGMYGTFS